MNRVLANGTGDKGSIPGRDIPKTQKIVLYAATHHIRYGSGVKWRNPGNGVAPSTTPLSSIYSTEVTNFTYIVRVCK